MTEGKTAFQDRIPDIHCFGCGPHNDGGLRIRSYWSGPDEAVCRFTPSSHHCAGPTHLVNGGIISTLIDCHSCCTAMAEAYRRAGRDIGEGDELIYVTGSLKITFRAPTPMGELTVRAKITETAEKKTALRCVVEAGGAVTAEGEVVAVRVPASWKAATR